ncbi:MAG: tRNA (adenosine(37)-N6)-dimethylallyltransferase MiaA [Capsulimonadales bacterium]|nr:tRNA (adenosine(37)-N6)-dimethylallyltransferase MiaA [Capsulimonadales bacterium]
MALTAERERPLVALVGPTAVGKTAVGIALAKRLGGEIISADAVAVYRGPDIGAAKPTLSERAEVPFHLIDVVSPAEDFTVTDFSRLAEEAISAIRGRGRWPIVVGGTGLYVRAVTATLTVPNVPPQPEIRAELQAESDAFGSAVLHARLGAIDPAAAARILPGDAKRIIRALEVYRVTGRPFSSFHTPEGVHGVPRPNTWQFGLRMDRSQLYARIEARVDAMLAAGFEDEVRGLLAAGFDPGLKALQSLGYRHLGRYVLGETDFETAVTELKRDTRRYARRQMIWFQADPNIVWYDRSVPSGERVSAGSGSGDEALAEAIAERLTGGAGYAG